MRSRARRPPAGERRLAADRAAGASPHRLDRRRAVAAREQAADRMHHRQRRGAGREGEERRMAGALGQKPSDPDHVAGHVVDQRVHGDHVVEAAKGRVQHVADAELDVPCQVAGQALAGQADQRRRQVDRDDLGAAPRRLDREARRCRSRHRAGAAPRRSSRQPVEQGARASGRGRRGRWRGCGRRVRPRSAATRPRRRCGRSRSAAARGARCR